MIKLLLRRLRDLREDHDLTQEEFAKAINISQRSYSHYENGTREVPIDILVSIADYYNTTTDYLLERTNIKTSTKVPNR